MRSFAERSPAVICAVGLAIVGALLVAALNYQKLPFVNSNADYSGYFADAGGLIPGAAVQVSGFRVGQVEGVSLDGDRVLIRFNVAKGIRLGDRTEAAIKTKSLLGAKTLEVTPRGEGNQAGPIPLERTRSPYQLPDALGDLTSTISGLNTDQISQSLSVLSNTFKDTPPELKAATEGVGRLSDTLNLRDEQLRSLLAKANTTTSVLAKRSQEIVALVGDTNALLLQLQTQSGALDQISGHISAVVRQVGGLIADNRDALKPALDKLNGTLAILNSHKKQVQEAIKKLNAYAMSLGEAVSSGPFYAAYLANLIPGQFLQPFVDAAFSDLGLDPATLLPSNLHDPQTGQPATPLLPSPFPRTGQGGEPRLNLPDAITGKPGDPRYPYREPLPAPPPGGPPPGPPAAGPPAPPPSSVHLPAPGEVSNAPSAGSPDVTGGAR